MHIDPAKLDLSERYKLQIGAIIPRPIAWVSTESEAGVLNLAPFSFFSAIAAEPCTLLICPSNRPDGSEKDTLANASATGEFVVNIVGEAQARAMSATAENVPADVSEFDFAGLEPAPSAVVRPPRVAGAPVSFECRTREIIRLAPGTPNGGNVVIGDIVGVHVEDGIIDDRYRIDPAKLAAVGRLAGLSYCSTRHIVEIPWGEKALGAPAPEFG
ncbi:MAG: flavin reductase family protein [Phycisphaeraceae bacterium]|nr:flavin reductase family protein [Phycisphaeraceae bacterium]MCB9847509.1 flavin reductase family protein [Phycisphaeraceae bacterium]